MIGNFAAALILADLAERIDPAGSIMGQADETFRERLASLTPSADVRSIDARFLRTGLTMDLYGDFCILRTIEERLIELRATIDVLRTTVAKPVVGRIVTKRMKHTTVLGILEKLLHGLTEAEHRCDDCGSPAAYSGCPICHRFQCPFCDAFCVRCFLGDEPLPLDEAGLLDVGSRDLDIRSRAPCTVTVVERLSQARGNQEL